MDRSGHDDQDQFEDAPANLSHAGAIVDKAIEYMASQDITPVVIASSLLGGALGVLSRQMDDESIVRVLENAIASVRSGELNGANQNEPDGTH